MEENIQSSFGKTVRRLRELSGFSQESFADKCKLHRTYVSDVELGKRNVSLENIEKISHALNMSISKLFMEVEKNESI